MSSYLGPAPPHTADTVKLVPPPEELGDQFKVVVAELLLDSAVSCRPFTDTAKMASLLPSIVVFLHSVCVADAFLPALHVQ
jgi:hypothetical protein